MQFIELLSISLIYSLNVVEEQHAEILTGGVIKLGTAIVHFLGELMEIPYCNKLKSK